MVLERRRRLKLRELLAGGNKLINNDNYRNYYNITIISDTLQQQRQRQSLSSRLCEPPPLPLKRSARPSAHFRQSATTRPAPAHVRQ